MSYREFMEMTSVEHMWIPKNINVLFFFQIASHDFWDENISAIMTWHYYAGILRDLSAEPAQHPQVPGRFLCEETCS